MDTLRLVLLFLHILGFAALIGGLLAQTGVVDKVVSSAMRDGAGTAFVAGLLLVGVLEAGDGDVNHAKIGAKLLIGLVILVLVMANLKKPKISDALFYGLIALSVITPTSSSPSTTGSISTLLSRISTAASSSSASGEMVTGLRVITLPTFSLASR